MRMRGKARKWVLNLWTIALTVLNATGLNPFDGVELMMENSGIVQDVQRWDDAPAGLDEQCVISGSGPDARTVIHRAGQAGVAVSGPAVPPD